MFECCAIVKVSAIVLTAQMAEWYRASALKAVDLGFPSQVKMTLKLVFTASLLDAQH